MAALTAKSLGGVAPVRHGLLYGPRCAGKATAVRGWSHRANVPLLIASPYSLSTRLAVVRDFVEKHDKGIILVNGIDQCRPEGAGYRELRALLGHAVRLTEQGFTPRLEGKGEVATKPVPLD